jgi:superfamily II DNA or RNA helicase
MTHLSLGKRGYVVKKENLTEEDVKKIERDLTFQPIVNQAFRDLTKAKKFCTYLESKMRYYLPRYYGIANFGSPLEDNLTNSGQDVDFKVFWGLKPHQEAAWKSLYNTFFVEKTGGGILQLPCGLGKTMLSIYLGSHLKKKMLVLVNKEVLLRQWKEAIEKCSNASVGIIQRNKIDIENRDIVIGMLHSVSMKDYPENIFNDFGYCVIDECFLGDQFISTERGPVTIEKLYEMWLEDPKRLPLVESYNVNTGKYEYCRITYAWNITKPTIYEMKFSGLGVIKCTPDHPFLLYDGRWKKAKELKYGDKVRSNTDRTRELGLIQVSNYGKFIRKTLCEMADDNEFSVFDLEIEHNHNFIVCNQQSTVGIVAHNCHHISSETFSKALPKVACQYTLGLSATPIRKDGLTEVFLNYLGPFIHRERRTNNNQVWIKYLEIESGSEAFDTEIMQWTGTKDTGKMVTNIAGFESINRLVIEICRILVQAPNYNRKILVLGSRREQLEWLNATWKAEAYNNYEGKIASGGLYYGNIRMNKKEYWNMLEESAKCDVIWGTSEIAKEGLDIPDLNTLVMLNGGSDVEQAVGRILRKFHEKTPPTVIDMVYKCGNFQRHANVRRDYYESEEYSLQKTTISIEDDPISVTQNSMHLEKYLNTYPPPGDKSILKPKAKSKKTLEVPLGNHPTQLASISVSEDGGNNGKGGSNGNAGTSVKKSVTGSSKELKSVPVEKSARKKTDEGKWEGEFDSDDERHLLEHGLETGHLCMLDSDDERQGREKKKESIVQVNVDGNLQIGDQNRYSDDELPELEPNPFVVEETKIGAKVGRLNNNEGTKIVAKVKPKNQLVPTEVPVSKKSGIVISTDTVSLKNKPSISVSTDVVSGRGIRRTLKSIPTS